MTNVFAMVIINLLSKKNWAKKTFHCRGRRYSPARIKYLSTSHPNAKGFITNFLATILFVRRHNPFVSANWFLFHPTITDRRTHTHTRFVLVKRNSREPFNTYIYIRFLASSQKPRR